MKTTDLRGQLVVGLKDMLFLSHLSACSGKIWLGQLTV